LVFEVGLGPIIGGKVGEGIRDDLVPRIILRIDNGEVLEELLTEPNLVDTTEVL
jgi:hypothetical protein